MANSQDSLQVSVLGDVAVDWLLAEVWDEKDMESSQRPDRILAVPMPGGAWFVANFVNAALEAGKRSDPNQRTAIISSYPWLSDYVFKLDTRVPSAVWDLGSYPYMRPHNTDPVYRLKRMRGYDYSSDHHHPPRDFQPPAIGPDVLVIDDMNLGFRDDPTNIELLDQLTTNNPHCLILLLISGFGLPARGRPRSAIWEHLAARYGAQTLAVVSANALRHIGYKISRGISWESTTEDYVREFPNIACLAGFGHVIARFGLTGAICSSAARDEAPAEHILCYDPDATDGIFRDQVKDGSIVGCNSVFIAWLVRNALQNRETLLRDDCWDIMALAQASLPSALRSCQRYFRTGYGRDRGELKQLSPNRPAFQNPSWPYWISDAVFDFVIEQDAFGRDVKDLYSDQRKDYPIIILKTPLPENTFEILTHNGTNPEQLFLVSKDIVKFGLEATFYSSKGDDRFSDWSHQFRAPITKFGNDFVVVDRPSIESYRELGELIKNYVQSNPIRPLSVAVFGPPGSGKSIGISSLARNISEDIALLSCNMTHMRAGTEDLAREFIKILDASRGNKVPLMLFDEFDCDDFAHLKSFLEPMEDSRFRYGQGELRLGRAIFAFAGGVHSTYGGFLRAMRDEKIDDFSDGAKLKKGPDFLSRLSGHINILPINFVGTNYSFLIRRAILLRFFLEDRGLTGPPQSRKHGIAHIEDDIINAMLGIDSYKYGARSMRAILGTCRQIANWITKAYLPTRDQLAMHVDPDQFLALVSLSQAEVLKRLAAYTEKPPQDADEER